MTLRKALLILQEHQKWRLGKSDYMNMPSEITEAINTILEYHIGDTTALIDQVTEVGKMVEISDEEIVQGAYWIDDQGKRQAWESGAKWYREQLKQRL